MSLRKLKLRDERLAELISFDDCTLPMSHQEIQSLAAEVAALRGRSKELAATFAHWVSLAALIERKKLHITTELL